MRLFFFFAISSIFWGHAQSQKLYFSNIPRLNNKAAYNKVIGENDGGIYVLRFRDVDLRTGFTIERYSHNLDFKESENYLLGKREKLIKVFTCDSGLCFIKVGTDRLKTEFTFVRSGFGIESFKSGKIFYTTSNIEKPDNNIIVEYSLNRKFCAIWTEEQNDEGKQIFHGIILKNDGQIISSYEYNTQLPVEDVVMEQVSVSDSGESAMVFVINHPEKRSTEAASEIHYITGLSSKGIAKPISLGDNKFFMSSYDLVYSEFARKFIFAGFYDYKKPKSAHGFISFDYLPADSILHANFNGFNRKLVGTIIGTKEEEEGENPENFYIRKIVPRSDGGILLVAEYFEISQQMETFYLNGSPQVSSKNVYNYNDLLLISINGKNETEWEHIVPKIQTSYASLSYLSSIGIYVCDTKVNIIYNDNSTQNNRVMHVSLSRDGFIDQKILLNSSNEYNAIVPMEGRQTGHNRYVVPLVQGRQTSLIQIVEVTP